MNILIIADKRIDELLPLTGDVASGLLPIAGKLLAEYVLEWICSSRQAKEVKWICGKYTNDYQKALGDGERWGIKMAFEKDLPKTDQACLIVRADSLIDIDINDFIRLTEQCPDCPCCGITGDIAGIYYVPSYIFALEVKNSNLALHWKYFKFEKRNSIKVTTAYDFQKVNMLIIEDQLTYFAVDPFQRGNAIVCGPRAKFSPSIVKSGNVFIGARSQVNDGASILGNTVIGNDVIIERHAVLKNSIVFPYTYVGEWVELNNVIVNGNMLYRLDNSVLLKVDEPFLLRKLAA